jgi:UDP-4-amino-4,6-dideoxy-N-acetyl-beta-L-altrosamine N-acetyltransferase
VPEVTLIPLDDTHTDRVLAWRADPIVSRELFSPLPPSREGHLAWLKTLGDSRREYLILAGAEMTPIGTIGLSQINQHHRHAEYGIAIGDRNYRGRGFAQAASHALLRIAFRNLRLHRVGLRVFADNPPALRLYERLGFHREGLLRDMIWSQNRFRDVVVMSLLESEWTAPGSAS